MEKAKEAVTALIWLAGTVVLMSDAPTTIPGQALAALAGFTLWGIAYIVWAVWGWLAAKLVDIGQFKPLEIDRVSK